MIARKIRPLHLQRCYQVASVAVSLINRVSALTRRASAPARRGGICHDERGGANPSRGRDAQFGKRSNEQRASDLRRCDEAWIRPSWTPTTVIHCDQQFCRNRRYRRHLCALYHWQSTARDDRQIDTARDRKFGACATN